MDKPTYAATATALLQGQANLQIHCGMVEDLIVRGGRVRGVACGDGTRLRAKAVVLATGTFLGGRSFRGDDVRSEGRFGEAPAAALSAALARRGFTMARLKTGTPPRIDKATIDATAMAIQPPSARPLLFSYRSEPRFAGPQLPCYVTETGDRTHALVRENLHRSPLYGLDLIRGIGPRYCPSIEDKVVKFAHNPSHQVFIEPEGWTEPTLYVGGFSTSLPAEVQLEMLHTLRGLEECVMLRAGYAVEYDMVQPLELRETLETRRIAGLFHCGQLNGTSGYEEAAAQGLVAGVNAAAAVRGSAPLRLSRSQAYIGVLVDDLVTRGVDEPYRMLSSRAEHRILLRHDNADLRLTPLGREVGLIDDEAWDAFQRRRDGLIRGRRAAERTRLLGTNIGTETFPAGSTVADALRRPAISYGDVERHFDKPLEPDLGERLEIELKCEGYARREEIAIERARKNEGTPIPEDFDYEALRALSREGREKLARRRPSTLGMAGRIPGVAPSDVAIVALFLHRAANQTPLAG